MGRQIDLLSPFDWNEFLRYMGYNSQPSFITYGVSKSKFKCMHFVYRAISSQFVLIFL